MVTVEEDLRCEEDGSLAITGSVPDPIRTKPHFHPVVTMRSTTPGRTKSAGFTLIEVLIVMIVVGVITALAMPRLDLQRYRTDAAVQSLRTVFQQAQRTALVRQYDVVISIDTAANALRWSEDANNNGTIQSTEHRRAYPLEDGVKFAVPPAGVFGSVSSSVVGLHLGTMDGLPTVTFHRDGAATSNLELYIAGPADPDVSYRAITLIQGTGRTDFYRYNTAGHVWELGGSK
jgi:prepilin-type N-terminal cleavage/methylation domain-containing protein